MISGCGQSSAPRSKGVSQEMSATRTLSGLLATLCEVFGLGEGSEATFGHLDSTLAQVQKSSFFTWFHLEQAGGSIRDGCSIVSFKPSEEQFHDLVTLDVTLDADNCLLALELILQRSFVDDSRNGVYARDIGKSFLLAVIPELEHPQIQDLANQIFHLSQRAGMIRRAGTVPDVPHAPTPGYLVWLGQQYQFEQVLEHGQLILENLKSAGGDVLKITVRPR